MERARNPRADRGAERGTEPGADPGADRAAMLILVGLGNPGRNYARHRHNVGFRVVDALAARYELAAARPRFHSSVAAGVIAGRRVLLLKPRTFMNDSGRAVGAALRFYKLRPRDVLVAHDDLDLVLGKVRVKTGGGAAGHNGLRSIDARIGRGYRRMRLGIGHPGDRGRVRGHVLSEFDAAEADLLDRVVDAVCTAMPLLIAGDDPGFMTRVALLNPPPKARADAG